MRRLLNKLRNRSKPVAQEKDIEQKIVAQNNSQIRNVFQAVITISNATWLASMLFILSIGSGLVLFFSSQTPKQPIFVTTGLESSRTIYFLNKPASIKQLSNIEMQQREELVKQNLDPDLAWLPTESIWVKVTSPYGAELILDNRIGITVLDFIPENAETPCTPSCNACGGNPIPIGRFAIEIPTQKNLLSWYKVIDFDKIPAVDLAFPHILKADLSFSQPGFYKLATALSYTFRGKDRQITTEIEPYLFSGGHCSSPEN
jgi:hypothetical protein